MNSKIKNRTLGATALLAVLLGSAACGNETVTDNGTGTQPGFEARIYPPVVAVGRSRSQNVPPAPLGEKKVPSAVSADAAERAGGGARLMWHV